MLRAWCARCSESGILHLLLQISSSGLTFTRLDNNSMLFSADFWVCYWAKILDQYRQDGARIEQVFCAARWPTVAPQHLHLGQYRAPDNMQGSGTKRRRRHHLLQQCQVSFSATAPDYHIRSIIEKIHCCMFLHGLGCGEYSETPPSLCLWFTKCPLWWVVVESRRNLSKPHFKAAAGGLIWYLSD